MHSAFKEEPQTQKSVSVAVLFNALFSRCMGIPLDPKSPRLVAELLVVLTKAQGITEVTGLLVGVLSGRPNYPCLTTKWSFIVFQDSW